MRIKVINHSFRSRLANRKRTTGIVFHHQAGTQPAKDVSATFHTWHRNNQTRVGGFWAGIGYHFVILSDGSIETGRPIDAYGAHAGNTANGSTVGICLTGNLDNHPATPAQVESAIWLAKYIMQHYKKELTIEGHNEHMSTSCPGKHFPMATIKEGVNEVRYKNINEMPVWMRPFVQRWVKQGIVRGRSATDLDITDDMVRTLIFAEKMLEKK